MRFLILLFLAGCAPYLEVGAGYAFDNGDYYNIRDDGAIGVVAIGLQGENVYCEYRHRSMLSSGSEVKTDDLVCMKRWQW